ncbi:Mn-dependent transcriptional regulator [Gottschalkia purinilytica]|uniref:Mn-dependent transcriptional regulator n=1 Tax=Gottschalkia purinilytica TaxID=1503 RepID=A0A0L0WDF5_GOTPU|nr:winged helix DNA-binding protein [Gottschalkia purinilytica]KNF09502.1 Mn-dependent transcriptional regulator [Gottschalkia purinilytica]
MGLEKSLEDYLETILILKNKKSIVRFVDIARYMNFSKHSVSHAVKELRKKDYLTMDLDGSLRLTEKGIDKIIAALADRQKIEVMQPVASLTSHELSGFNAGTGIHKRADI